MRCAECGTETASNTVSVHNAEQSSKFSKEAEPQRVLNNRYYILSLLGRGGMGAVYLATDTACKNRVVALRRRKPRREATCLKPSVFERSVYCGTEGEKRETVCRCAENKGIADT